MHPIEHLRYVARASSADASSLARETAVALGSLRADPASLVIACRRIVDRHPSVGPLWWLCSKLLTAEDPSGLAWDLAAEIEDDRTAVSVAAALAEASVVVTIGWPEVAGASLMRRGDVTVYCADSRHEASSFLQRLERYDVACEPIPGESLAHAVGAADLVMIDALAASEERVLAPVGSAVLAAVAVATGTPCWLVTALGRRLPGRYVEEMSRRLADGSDPWEREVDELSPTSITHVADRAGVVNLAAVGHRDALGTDCPFAPELLRTSSF